MSGFESWLSSHGPIDGSLMLLLWAAGVVTALVIVVGVLAYRDFAMRDMVDTFLRTAGIVVVAVLGWTWIDYSAVRERTAERRALDVRASELSARATAPGSALACLTPVGIEAVDTACEQAVFASPQSVSAALAYVDAQLSLLADGLEYASRDPNYGGVLERPRRTLEADRFGFVAHVLETRGCTPEECAAFKLLRYAGRVKSNLKDHAFAAHVAQYAANWSPNGAVAATASPPVNSAMVPPAGAPNPPTTSSASRFNFPSSASIPPVSIMSAEPTGSTTPNSASTEPPAPETKKPPARRQSANKPPAAQNKLPPPPAPPPPRTQ